MMKLFSCLMCFVFSFSFAFSQSKEYEKHLDGVLRKSAVNRTFTFNSGIDRKRTTTSSLTFLGNTNTGEKIIYIKETYPAAATRHGYVMLIVQQKNGKKYYYRDIDKPEKMKEGILYFKHLASNNRQYFFTQDLNKDLPKFLCVDKNDCYNYTD